MRSTLMCVVAMLSYSEAVQDSRSSFHLSVIQAVTVSVCLSSSFKSESLDKISKVKKLNLHNQNSSQYSERWFLSLLMIFLKKKLWTSAAIDVALIPGRISLSYPLHKSFFRSLTSVLIALSGLSQLTHSRNRIQFLVQFSFKTIIYQQSTNNSMTQ